MQNMKSARNQLKTPGEIVSGGVPTIKNRRPRFVGFDSAPPGQDSSSKK